MTDKVVKQPSDVHLIVFACEAGMGSSLMGANQLKKLIKKGEAGNQRHPLSRPADSRER